jgi:hypothetical protein
MSTNSLIVGRLPMETEVVSVKGLVGFGWEDGLDSIRKSLPSLELTGEEERVVEDVEAIGAKLKGVTRLPLTEREL